MPTRRRGDALATLAFWAGSTAVAWLIFGLLVVGVWAVVEVLR